MFDKHRGRFRRTGAFVIPAARWGVLDTRILSMGHVGMCLTNAEVDSDAMARLLDKRQDGMCLTDTF